MALEELAGGADCLRLIFAGAAHGEDFGLTACDDATLAAVFDRIDPAADLWIELDPGGPDCSQPLALAAFLARRAAPERLDVSFGANLSRVAIEGAGASRLAVASRLAPMVRSLREMGFAGPFAVADGRPLQAAGASLGQELGIVAASALAGMRALCAEGFSADVARDAISFHLVADQDQFLSLAKFRALRLIWGRILEASGLPASQARVAGSTASGRDEADPWRNLMRGAVAAFSAGLGGADSFCILPAARDGQPAGSDARRLARMAQILLLEESHLGLVGDPAAGAGAFEALTADLCRAAWAVFQKVEARGGAFRLLAAADGLKRILEELAVSQGAT